ncbi:MAG TPA: AI-2E family transporter [Chloroflexota bacterium]
MSQVKIGARVALGAAAVLLGLILLYLIRPVLVILLVSIIFAQAISPAVLALRRAGARRAAAVVAIYLVILAALAALGWALASAISSQLATLMEGLPEMRGRLQALAAGIPVSSLRDTAQSVLSGSAQPNVQPEQAVPGLLHGLSALLESIFGVFTIFVVTFYWISERLVIRRTLLRLFPREHRERGLTVWEDVEDKLGLWVRGQLLVMLCIGGLFALGLGVMGVRFWLLLAVFAAVAEIIPIAGPWLGTVPAVLVALTQSFQLALMVTAYGAAVQLLENNLILPRIVGHTTGISPLTVILGILTGATLAGIAGALLAVPVAAAMQVLLHDLHLIGEDEQPVAEVGRQRPARHREPVHARN